MPKSILLANLGNRNLRWQGKFIDNGNFREKTEELLQAAKERLQELELEILPTILDEKKTELDQVILFATDQSAHGVRTNQDTIYAAQLVEKLLLEKYPSLNVSIEKVEERVTDANALMRFYRYKLAFLRNLYPDQNFVILDAGGAPLLKSSLKITAEFVLKYHPYEVYNVAREDNNHSVLEKIEPVEYRRILEAEEAQALVLQGFYDAAIQIIWGDKPKEGNKLYKVLKGASCRMLHLWRDWQQYSAQLARKLEKSGESLPAFVAQGKELEDEQLSGQLDSYLNPYQSFVFKEYLQLAYYYYKRGNYNSSVLHFFNGMEYYLNEVARNELIEGENSRNRRKMEGMIRDELNTNLPDYPGLEEWMRNRKIKDVGAISLPVLILALAREDLQANALHHRLINEFKKGMSSEFTNRTTCLKTLRNNMVHEGRSITADDITEAKPKAKAININYEHFLLGLLEAIGGGKNAIVDMNDYCAEKVTELLM